MKKFLWSLTTAGSIIGAFILFIGLFTAKGAPQEASAAAIAIAFAVIPYCLARAASEKDYLDKNS